MTVYVESSAVLAWLLREADGVTIRATLDNAEQVVSSQLTLVECRRALHRDRRSGRLSEADSLAARRMLDEAAEHWAILDLAGDVTRRAAEPFPEEPVRTLDALHLASALIFNESLGQVVLLTLDARLARNAEALGLTLAA